MIKMEEIPHRDYAENWTDGKLFDEIEELKDDICEIIEGYCKNNDLGFGVYAGWAYSVRNLIAYAWEAGRRQLIERPMTRRADND